MPTLKEVAAKIAVSFMRIGFNPETEQTKYIASIKTETFEFSCGLFACIPRSVTPKPLYAGALASPAYDPLKRLERSYKHGYQQYNYEQVFKQIRSGEVKALKNWGTWAQKVWDDIVRLQAPTAYDLLYCLQSDSSAENQTFEQWCGEFGYDTDSRKAFDIFTACQINARKLRTAVGPDVFKEIMEAEPD